MLARYLQKALTVEQIGYCDRISESAVQYAERLLSTRQSLVAKAPTIARELVHDKDHGFVIDLAEAKQHLGDDWIRTGTPELQAEAIYSLLEMVNFILDFSKTKRDNHVATQRSPRSAPAPRPLSDRRRTAGPALPATPLPQRGFAQGVNLPAL